MIDCKLRQITRREYLQELSEECSEVGLEKAVEQRLDDINGFTRSLDYLKSRAVQELMSEILDLIRISQGDKTIEASAAVESMRTIVQRK